VETTCPTCGKELASERGMRQHHTKVHDEPLPNRTCKGCGVEFYDSKARRTYCDDCDPNAGKNNGNWTGAKETTECERCGSLFEYFPSDKEGIYCASCIENGKGLSELGTDEYAKRVTMDCEQCGKEMKVLQSRVERSNVRFCGRKCRDTWLSEEYRGEKHHAWKGGEVKYGGGWWAVREEARNRDEQTCQNCGVSKEELGQHPDIHHVTPVRDFDEWSEAHRLDNVISLCPSCHQRIESGTLPLPDGPWK
jgi:5-methylcytosine-specific restriction endonuclease McrA